VRSHRGSSRHGGVDPPRQPAGSSAAAAHPGAGDAALEAHASHAVHQLGEAVVLLAGNTELLRAGAPGPGDVAEVVRGLAAGTERARRYVDDLLDVLATARELLEPVAIDLGAALGAARDDLAGAFARAGARLEVEPLPAVALDPDLAGRLSTHLLRGALAAAQARPLHIAVHGRRSGALVRVEVRDDGEPLDPATAAGHFAAFARPRGRGPLLGAGVSATVCRRIVTAHGGAIEVRPAPGGGAVVSFTVPAAG
jgi:signal transduction histidine kinase